MQWFIPYHCGKEQLNEIQINNNKKILYVIFHWNGNVIILIKFSSLALLEFVKMTTFGAARWHFCQNDHIPLSVLEVSYHFCPLRIFRENGLCYEETLLHYKIQAIKF